MLSIKLTPLTSRKEVSTSRRVSTICRVTQSTVRTVFQVERPFRDVTLEDVEDSVIATQMMVRNDAKEYMMSQGIDIDRVEQYYFVVQHLEKQYRANNKQPVTWFQNINIFGQNFF